MLKTIIDWWHDEEVCTKEPELTLAITKLMVGMMNMDGRTEEEYNEIVHMLGENFELSDEAAKDMIDQAMDDGRTDLAFSKVVAQIEKNYTIEKRASILSLLWRIAIADNDIDFIEEQYVNRLASLLDVPTKVLNEVKAEQERKNPNINQSNRYRDPMA